jgi:hypothetical protein
MEERGETLIFVTIARSDADVVCWWADPKINHGSLWDSVLDLVIK